MDIQDRKECVRITFLAIAFYRRSDQRLTENQVRQVCNLQGFSIALEQLNGKTFERNVIDIRVGVEKFKVDVNQALLEAKSDKLKARFVHTYNVAVVAVVVSIVLFAFRHCREKEASLS